MRTVWRLVVGGILMLALVGVVVIGYVRATGLSAKGQPSALEARVARALRSVAVSSDIKGRRSPVPASKETLAEGMAHYADHCASCHANDGSGNTEMGRGLFPPVPDMRLSTTQGLTDGELFYIIENGVRFTGMPGWSTGTPTGETATWHLVQFVRHLPRLTVDELAQMETLNPRSPEEVRQEIEEEQFLKGDDVTAPRPSTTSPHTGAHQ